MEGNIMKKWILTASRDGNLIDYETIIEAEAEPDFWTCYDLASAAGCPFFTIDQMEV